MKSNKIPVEQLKNIGPNTADWLHEIQIYTLGDLEAIGAPLAHHLIKSNNHHVTLVLLYALYGAIHNRNWLDLSPEEKEHLQMELKLVQLDG